MLKPSQARRQMPQQGVTLLEVLVTIVILAFGMLGLAGLQLKTQTAEMESYQRAQALVLMNDMVERVTVNRANAASFVSATVWGSGDTTYTGVACTTLAVGTVARDWCEWSSALQGSSELSASAQKVGAMVGARGCISSIQAANPTSGVCTPAIYEVAVAWQGLSPISIPASTCGQELYGSNDALRRVVTTRITVGLPGCS